MESIENAKVITSCGSTGIFIDGQLNEDFDVTILKIITSHINRPFEIEFVNEDGSVSSEPEFGDGFDEWIINIK